jgi:hypothetical protein
MNDDNAKQQIIDAITERTGDLLEKRWEAIEALRVDPEASFKISFGHRLSFRGDQQIVKSTISFGLRESESVETTIEDGSQMALFGAHAPNGNGVGRRGNQDADAEGEESLSIAQAAARERDPAPPLPQKRGRGRPRKS